MYVFRKRRQEMLPIEKFGEEKKKKKRKEKERNH